jgi:YidC/Oxa1 family membrane protein insertase
MLFRPFVAIVEFLFLGSLRLTRDPGTAVLCLSLALSLLLLPLFFHIEKLKRRQRGIQNAMQGALDEISATYRGRERHYYTREIHRLHGYSPVAALIPSLGLLVQIPFLLAAYRYLSTYPGFEGASFSYIGNLNRPDTVASLGSFPINLLPLVMTAVNLYSGWLYGKGGKPSERMQYMLVAVIFLVVLYSAPASVLLYWTCSNVLAVARLRITNPEVFVRSGS